MAPQLSKWTAGRCLSTFLTLPGVHYLRRCESGLGSGAARAKWMMVMPRKYMINEKFILNMCLMESAENIY